jgi:hypothetical protein
LMGAIEAPNGMMLFGLSTAFLFAVLRAHWPTRVAISREARLGSPRTSLRETTISVS